MAAQIVMAGGTHAVPAPVPEGFDNLMKKGIIGIHGSSLTHGHVVGRIKAGGSDIADGSRKTFFPVYGVS